MTRSSSSPPDHDARWRPDGDGPECGYTLAAVTCEKSGPHYCEPRADRAVQFFEKVLVHVKGLWARQSFQLEDWQEHEIVRPLFGEVIHSEEWRRYLRRYRLGYIVVARKNGKSSLISGLVLLLAVADDEPGAEVYGAAKDTKQAGKVFEPAVQMAKLSPLLNKRLDYNKNNRRLYDERTSSYIETITRDALGELGHNPHGGYIDEVLSQPDASLFHALRTAMGTRHQPLLLLITTETNDPSGFGAKEIDEAERIQADPSRAPHVFSFVRKTPKTDKELERLQRLFPDHPDLPVSTDPWDEDNWRWANPALGQFKSMQSMRELAIEAQNDPSKQAAFLQFELNQRQQQTTRFLELDLWDANVGEVAASPGWLVGKHRGEPCTAGLDLSAKLDLTAWTLLFDDNTALWRFWVPESVVPLLDDATADEFSVWCDEGWITVTDGDVIDYDSVYDTIQADAERFAIADVTYDVWSGEPVRQEIVKRTGLDMVEARTTYEQMTEPLKELQRSLKAREGPFHGGNPVVRWQAEALEVKTPADDPDRMRPVKPDRNKTGKRIDGMVTLLMAIQGQQRRQLALDEPEDEPATLIRY